MALKIDVEFGVLFGAVPHLGRRPTCFSFIAFDAQIYILAILRRMAQ